MTEADDDTHPRPHFLEVFKAFSTFISSVIIAFAGIFITTEFNNRQLEITHQQAESQLALARIKEISVLVPKLGSSDKNERKFSAVALGLYGENAIPALMAIMDDEDGEVRVASSKSLALIGDVAVPHLTRAYLNGRNTLNVRTTSLYTLGLMKADSGYEYSIAALKNRAEHPVIRKDAATVLGMFANKASTGALVEVLRTSKETDISLSSNIVWALGQIADVAALEDLAALLKHPNEGLRIQIVWALANMKGERATKLLSEVAAQDSSAKVKQDAVQALELQRRL